jgi:hypothetical protein
MVDAARRWFAIGDIQASKARLLDVLGRHDLIDGTRLRPDVGLISVGDYFDFGPPPGRAAAAAEGLEVVRWLASHPAEQVVIIAGNHDIARIGEMLPFSDTTFAEAYRRASAVYVDGEVIDPAGERALMADYPWLPGAELVARDFSCFDTAQRALVIELLGTRRLRLAHAIGGRLICHAGITRRELGVLGLAGGSVTAEPIADALNEHLDRAFEAWNAQPDRAFEIPGLHTPGSGAGEGGGMLYHRPADPRAEGEASPSAKPRGGASSRRFDPRDLPMGLIQVIGHISDKKCRELMPAWSDDAPSRLGVLRHLETDGDAVRYAHGLPSGPPGPTRGTLVFIDGGLGRCEPAEYELYAVS